MSSLYITEYAAMAPRSQIPQEPPIAEQKITFTGTAGVSAAFNAATNFIRIETDGIGSVLVSQIGTLATTNNGRIASGVPEVRAVKPGWAISAITNT